MRQLRNSEKRPRDVLISDLCHERICGGLIKVRIRHRDVANVAGLEDDRFFAQPDIEVEDRQARTGVLQKRIELAFPRRRRWLVDIWRSPVCRFGR